MYYCTVMENCNKNDLNCLNVHSVPWDKDITILVPK